MNWIKFRQIFKRDIFTLKLIRKILKKLAAVVVVVVSCYVRDSLFKEIYLSTVRLYMFANSSDSVIYSAIAHNFVIGFVQTSSIDLAGQAS